MRYLLAKTVVLALTMLMAAGALCAGQLQPAARTDDGTDSRAGAPEPSPSPTPSPFDVIEAKRRELNQLETRVRRATGVDKEALEKRVVDLSVEIVKDLQSLAVDIAARQKAGEGVGADRRRVTDLLRQASLLIRKAIIRLENRMAQQTTHREDVSPDEATQIDRRLASLNARLNTALYLLVRQVQVMDALSIPSARDREFIESHLKTRAMLLAGRIELERSSMDGLWDRIRANQNKAELRAQLKLERADFDRLVTSLKATIQMMETLDMDTAEYRELLFKATGQITTGLLKPAVLGGLLRSIVQSTKTWLTTEAPRLVFRILVFLLILVAFRVLAKLSRKTVGKILDTSKVQTSHLLKRTVQSVTGTLVMIVGLLVALSQLGLDMTPLLAGFGVAGIVVGFALQDSFANFAAGVMILVYRPYDTGDLIEVAGTLGKVENMTLVATTLLTIDHQTLVIPNNKIWGDVIRNVTAQKIRRVDMVFGVSYSDDIEHAERVLAQILEAHPKVLDNPAPVIKVHELGDSSVNFIVRPWVKTSDYWDVYWDVTREVKLRFDAEGISIPFPQQDVHIVDKTTEHEG